jgi:hypothetical protein
VARVTHDDDCVLHDAHRRVQPVAARSMPKSFEAEQSISSRLRGCLQSASSSPPICSPRRVHIRSAARV